MRQPDVHGLSTEQGHILSCRTCLPPLVVTICIEWSMNLEDLQPHINVAVRDILPEAVVTQIMTIPLVGATSVQISRLKDRSSMTATRRDAVSGCQKLRPMPTSIFRMPLTVVGLAKNGDVIVPL